MKQLLWIILTLGFSIGLGGCVSINLGGSKTERSKKVEFKSPPRPFTKESSEHVDAAWKNPHNGNSISYISECGPQDPSLETLRAGVLGSLKDPHILNEDRSNYNGRAALRTEASGSVDGIESKVDLMVFKKNNCIYILTYAALTDSFETDRSHFENFLKEFVAP